MYYIRHLPRSVLATVARTKKQKTSFMLFARTVIFLKPWLFHLNKITRMALFIEIHTRLTRQFEHISLIYIWPMVKTLTSTKCVVKSRQTVWLFIFCKVFKYKFYKICTESTIWYVLKVKFDMYWNYNLICTESTIYD